MIPFFLGATFASIVFFFLDVFALMLTGSLGFPLWVAFLPMLFWAAIAVLRLLWWAFLFAVIFGAMLLEKAFK